MSIPCKVSPLGVGDRLPAGYSMLDFLESTQGGKNNILTYINVPTNVNAIDDSFEIATLHEVPGNRISQEGVNCRFFSFHWIWQDNQWKWHSVDLINNSGNTNKGPILLRFKRDYPSNSVFFYNGDSSHVITGTDRERRYVWPMNPVGVFWDINNPDPLYISTETKYNTYAALGKKWWWKFRLNGKLENDLRPCLDDKGEPCMFDLVTGKTFYNEGSLPFVAGVKTVCQLFSLLRRLPRREGSLLLSLPASANSPEVAEALQAAHEDKGWTFTVREYRPAEVTSYSLRRVREVVWVRKVKSEQGTYIDSDGVRWLLERCVAVFGALGQEPADYGFEPFDSIAQAEESWHLSVYE